MRREPIPEHVRKEADAVIRDFNEKVIKDANRHYIARHKGGYLYLDRLAYGARYRIARLTYDNSTGSWGFAIFKYSDERYAADEWVFPGSEFLDGTLEGALKAGLEAYP